MSLVEELVTLLAVALHLVVFLAVGFHVVGFMAVIYTVWLMASLRRMRIIQGSLFVVPKIYRNTPIFG